MCLSASYLRFVAVATAVGTDSAGENAAMTSKTTARERRLVKVREECRNGEEDAEWTRVLLLGRYEIS
jgi:hypothetical protein